MALTATPRLSTAVRALKNALPAKSKDRTQLVAIADRVAALLKAKTGPVEELSVLLRQSLPALYAASPRPAFALADAALIRLLDLAPLENGERADVYLSHVNALLSGLLDFLEDHQTREIKHHLAIALFNTLASLSFPEEKDPSKILDANVLCSAFTLLSESTAGHGPNQHFLRESILTGGRKLGLAISRCKDFLVLESILTLFARLIPPNDGTAAGRVKRTQFINTTWSTHGRILGGSIVADFLQAVKEQNWDAVPIRIIDILAENDITFPQPVSLAGFKLCGALVPRLSDADRMYIEHSGLFINITTESGDYESLQIPYKIVRNISLSHPSGSSKSVSATVQLSEVPQVGDVLSFIAGAPLELSFELKEPATNSHFVKICKSRNLSLIESPVSVSKRPPRISINESSANLDFGRLDPCDTDSGHKVKDVVKFYEVDADDKSDDSVQVTQKLTRPPPATIDHTKPPPSETAGRKSFELISPVHSPSFVPDGSKTEAAEDTRNAITMVARPVEDSAVMPSTPKVQPKPRKGRTRVIMGGTEDEESPTAHASKTRSTIAKKKVAPIDNDQTVVSRRRITRAYGTLESEPEAINPFSLGHKLPINTQQERFPPPRGP